MKKNYNLLLLCFFLIFSCVLSAQHISNVQLEYSCPCRVTVNFTFTGDDADVVLYYSPTPDPGATWMPAVTFPATGGTNTHIWDCEDDGVLYGLFYFKLEPILVCDLSTISMKRVAGGTFHLGSVTQNATFPNMVTPVAVAGNRKAIISAFYMSETLITQAQFETVMSENPATFQGSVYEPSTCKPVENVSWYHAIAFCNKLSLREGKTLVYNIVGIDWVTLDFADIPTTSDATWDAVTMNINASGYRLPTEAEWEYAARGGNQSFAVQGLGLDFYFSGSNDINEVGWSQENNGNFGTATWGTKRVGQLLPNALGLYDMCGNLWEWCWDRYVTPYPAIPLSDPTGPLTGGRTSRGGGWGGDVASVVYRDPSGSDPWSRNQNIGFRVVCTEAVMINGVRWAPFNVDEPGTFAESLESHGLLYQWDIPVGWSSVDPMVSTPTGATWNTTASSNARWLPDNDPSPSGYRVPSDVELNKLLAATFVTKSNVTTLNGVSGIWFTDRGADGLGNAGNAIFLPAVGYRSYTDGASHYVNEEGYYWSSKAYGATTAWSIFFYSDFPSSTITLAFQPKPFGYSVRPVTKTCGIYDISMKRVEGGTFHLGSATQDSEIPVASGAQTWTGNRTVEISTFYMSETPVTQAQFWEVMGANPSNFQGSTNIAFEPAECKPVERVNWYHAIAFCNKLSLLEGKTLVYNVDGIDWATLDFASIPTLNDITWDAATIDLNVNGYRLPTEAEWEYAARGGNQSFAVQGLGLDFYYSGSNTAGDVGWWQGNNGSANTFYNGTKPVKLLSPNALGLYDMSGNVFEWCWDRYVATYPASPLLDPTGTPNVTLTDRVYRSGGSSSAGVSQRVSTRNSTQPGNSSTLIGFRLVYRSQ